jgi:superfamily II DNA or RNA helicase
MARLRQYQRNGNEAAKEALRKGYHRVGIALPTGTGKTNMMAANAADILTKGRRCMILTHRDPLIPQTVATLKLWVPASSIGIIKANKNDVGAPVTVASVHTLKNPKRLAQIEQLPDLTQVDEAHVSVADIYMRVFEKLDLLPGGSHHAIGFSATWVRSDNRGLGDIWEDIVFRRSIRWAVRNGFLVEPRALQCGQDVDLNLDSIRVGKDGEYLDSDAANVVMIDSLRDRAVKAYLQHANGRSMALFAPTQEAVRYFLEGFREADIQVAEYMYNSENRETALIGFNNGSIKILGTCHALAEGWDAPRCDCVMLLTPIKFVGRFIQIFGRALRPWPGKVDGLLLDMVRATDDKELSSVIDLRVTPPGASQEELDEICEVELAAARQREAAERGLVKDTIRTREVDMFAGTEARWLTTDFGVPFVMTRDNLYFVVQNGAGFNVGVCDSRSRRHSRWLAEGLDPQDALEVGSDAALAEDPSIASKNSSWRKGRRAPSMEQIGLAKSLGIDEPEHMTKGQLGDAISIAMANHLLAPLERKPA